MVVMADIDGLAAVYECQIPILTVIKSREEQEVPS